MQGSTGNADPTTGFYGKWGAGCIFMARSTNRFLLAHRSDNPPPYDVEQPGTWGTWGGAGYGSPTKQAVIQRVRTEVHEETGHNIDAQFLPLYVFKKNTFQYFNFLAILDEEFEPHLNWESQGYRWCKFGEWPSPLHFGLKAVLSDPHSLEVMRQAAAQSPSKAV